MNVFFKRIIFLAMISVMIIACGGDDQPNATNCKSDTDCSNNEECRFNSKTSVKGECVTKVKCQNNNECGDRDCDISLEGEDKYCGGYLINFNFKTGSTLKTGKVNENYNEIIELEGKTGSFFMMLEGSLPDGLLLNAETGDITGKPTVKGEFTFKVIAYNGKSDSNYYYNIIKVEKEFTIAIDEEIVCTPKTCDDLSIECGATDDGCGTNLDCGGCDASEACIDGLCEATCIPKTCDELQWDCGSKDDGCGTDLDCGTCANGTCNTTNGKCEANCVPKTCDDLSIECGATDDGCGTNLDCGGCDASEACIGGLCESTCIPKTCAELQWDCGSKDDGCGTDLDCGTCADGTCNTTNGKCEVACVPDCTDKTCGNDGCGDVCDVCAGTGETCDYQDATCATTSIAGQIVITEFMPNPKVVGDTSGEWIEIYNTTDNPIDITNLKILKNATSKGLVFETNASTEIQPHSYFVIARKIATESMLPVVDATSAFSLTQDGASLSLELNGELLDTIIYSSSSEAKSWQVEPVFKDHDLNDYDFAWCKGSTVISDTNADKGTPGLANISCP